MDFISKWKDKIAHYVDVRLSLLKLGFIEKTSNILSYLIFVFIGLFLGLSILLFVGIALGEYFAAVFSSRTAGFMTTVGFYAILLICLFGLRKAIITAFSSVFIRILTSGNTEEDREEMEESKHDKEVK
ncbi:MAG: hypothetical protein JST52_08620 [Bacteroidetes bacterium]|nr:hypothetical protein [Bacteroidota bacterium]MBS1739388.1 hypothetical protein [Bacteroidota bacterium]